MNDRRVEKYGIACFVAVPVILVFASWLKAQELAWQIIVITLLLSTVLMVISYNRRR